MRAQMDDPDDYIQSPVNTSKGWSGVRITGLPEFL